MNIIILCDICNSQINKDFKLANALKNEHTILLSYNENQVLSAIKSYDTILVGFSYCKNVIFNLDKPLIDLHKINTKNYIQNIISEEETLINEILSYLEKI